MQKSNEHAVNYTLLAVPADLLEEVGIDEFTEVEMWVADGRLIMEPIDEAKEDVLQMGYESLEDFLESLSPRNQYDAFCFLSMLLAVRKEANEMRAWVAENE